MITKEGFKKVTMEEALKYYPWQSKLRDMQQISFMDFVTAAKEAKVPKEDIEYAEHLWGIWRKT